MFKLLIAGIVLVILSIIVVSPPATPEQLEVVRAEVMGKGQ